MPAAGNSLSRMCKELVPSQVVTAVDVSTSLQSPRLGGPFAKLWGATTASALGLGLESVATPLLIASRTTNPLVVSGAFAASTIPMLIFGLPAGVIVDRLDRRRLMIWVDWVRAGVLALLAAAIISNHVSIAMLYVVLVIVSTGEVLMRSSSSALLPLLVPKDRLERANGWLIGGVTLTGSMISGPFGGLLFVVAAGLPFVANAVTFVASALLVTLIAGTYRSAPAAEPSEKRRIREDVVVGLKWLMRQRLLRTMAILIGLLNVTLTAALAILVLLAKQRLHLDSVGYGVLFTAMAVGALIGSALGDRLIKLVTATWTIRIGLIIEAGFHLVLATSTSAYAVGGAFLLFGVHGALWTIVSSSLRQRLTPDDMMGRVSSAYLFVSAGGNCIGAVLGGALASAFGLTAPYWVGFVVAVAVSAATWRVFNRRDVAAAYAMETAHAE
jgi:MFS family permease